MNPHADIDSPASFTSGRWRCQIRDARGHCVRLEFQDPGDGGDVTGWYWSEQGPGTRSALRSPFAAPRGRPFRAAAGTWYSEQARQGGILLRGAIDGREPLSLRIPATSTQDDLFRPERYPEGQTHVSSDEQGRCFAVTLIRRPGRPTRNCAAWPEPFKK